MNTTGGVIFFSTTLGTTGNDNNTITLNTITCAADASRPVNMIYSLGTSNKDNDGITISSNNIYNFMNPSLASNGIFLTTYTSASTISGNNFYETTSFAPTAAVTYIPININASAGVNFTVSNNRIGGSSANCGDPAWTKTSANNNIFMGISLSVGTATASNVQGNIIRNFAYANSSNATWNGINVTNGAVNLGTSSGNTIGAGTGTGSITYTAGASSGAVNGIWISSAGTVMCQNNIIGSITAGNSTAANNTNCIGIYKSSGGTTTISGNTIGSTATANSIFCTSASSASNQLTLGIYNLGSGTITISGNTISKLKNGSTNTSGSTLGYIDGIYVTGGTNTITNNTICDLTIANGDTVATHQASVCGIAISNTAAAAQRVTGNSISNLSNTYASFAGNIIGLYFNGGTTASVISENFVSGLSVDAASVGAALYGIKINAGAATYSNNILSLGGNTQSTLYGIYETGALNNNDTLYFNTISLTGTPASGALNSYALYSTVTTNKRVFMNNVFSNTRSNSGATGKHYAAYFAAAVDSAGLTQNYNDYYAPGASGGTLGYFNGADVLTLAAWRTATKIDGNSLNTSPGLVNTTGTTPGDYKVSASLAGVSGTSVTTDYLGSTRTGYTMGAFDASYDVWTGTANTTWEDASNWSGGIPSAGMNVVVAAGSAHMPVTGTAVTVGSLELQSGMSMTLGADVQLNSVLTLSSGVITLGNYNLTLGSTAVVSGTPSASNMIVATGTGELRKTFTGTGSFTFPVGDMTGTPEYSPVTLNFTSGTFASAYAGVSLSNTKHVNNSSSVNFLNRYWTLTQSGITAFSCVATMQYVPADVAGTETSIWGGKWNQTTWALANQVNAVNHTLTQTVTDFSVFTGGEQSVLPVELSSFTSSMSARNLVLKWETATEKNNYGFEIERKQVPLTVPGAKPGTAVFAKIGFVEGSGTTNAPKRYSFDDRNIQPGKFAYRLKQIDRDGNFEYSQEIEVIVSAPKIFALEQNYPNPFNPSTTINYQLPVAKHVSLKIYDAIGREAATLVDEVKDAGYYSVQFDGARFSSGIYFARLISDNKTQIRKLMLLK